MGLSYARENVLKSLILLDGGYIRASHLPDNSMEVEATKSHIENYIFDSWQHYEEELAQSGLSNHLIELS